MSHYPLLTEAEKVEALGIGRAVRSIAGSPLFLPRPLYETLKYNGLKMDDFAVYPKLAERP